MSAKLGEVPTALTRGRLCKSLDVIIKAIIIGNGGSGKTWLAKKIVSTEAQIIHLDNLFWPARRI